MKKEDIRGIFKKDVLAGKADGKDILTYIHKWTDEGEEAEISLSGFLGLSDVERNDWTTKKRSIESVVDEWKTVQLMDVANDAIEELEEKSGDCACINGDTVFEDLIAKRKNDISGEFKEMMEIYQKSSDKDSVSNMFKLITGFSVKDYLMETKNACQKESEHLEEIKKAGKVVEFQHQNSVHIPQCLLDRAKNVIQCFVLTGTCTEMYIVNALARISKMGDGEGHFSSEDFPVDNDTVNTCTSYLMYQFASSIPAEYKSILKRIIRTGKLPDQDVRRMILGEIIRKEDARRMELASCNDPRFPFSQNRVFMARMYEKKFA